MKRKILKTNFEKLSQEEIQKIKGGDANMPHYATFGGFRHYGYYNEKGIWVDLAAPIPC